MLQLKGTPAQQLHRDVSNNSELEGKWVQRPKLVDRTAPPILDVRELEWRHKFSRRQPIANHLLEPFRQPINTFKRTKLQITWKGNLFPAVVKSQSTLPIRGHRESESCHSSTARHMCWTLHNQKFGHNWKIWKVC